MRASSFFKLSSLAIVIFTVSFLFTMYWVGSALSSSKANLVAYQELKFLVSIDFNRTINEYLEHGDASLLTKADAQLTQINAQVKKINQLPLQKQVSNAVSELQHLLTTTIRATGKLSGDPQVLLRNSESSLISLAAQLSQYAQISSVINDEQKFHYLRTTDAFSQALGHLLLSRERAFQHEVLDTKGILFTLQEVKAAARSFAKLPTLSVFEEIDEDELGFDSDEPADELSSEAINELNNLVNRYQSELKSTLAIFKQKNSSLALLKEKVNALEMSIVSNEKDILTSQEKSNETLVIVVILLLSFLVLFLFINHLLQHRIILRPLRLLRNSFLVLIEQGKVNNIDNIAKNTELGEIAHSFNQLVNQLAQEDTQKAQQLSLVSNALHVMQNQASDIEKTSTNTSKQVDNVKEVMTALGEATDTVNTLSQQVVESAQGTQQAMNESKAQVNQALEASETTTNAAQSGNNAIKQLGQSVNSVSSIVDVISAIAEQTNLLALNAAIEAARAGDHGRGFSVVASEVRQLAGKTQDSLQQINGKLSQLQHDSGIIEKTMLDIKQASAQQQKVALLLKDNAEQVSEQAKLSANIAHDALGHITQQREHYHAFEKAMFHVNKEVTESKDLAENITIQVNNQVKDIGQTLRLVS